MVEQDFRYVDRGVVKEDKEMAGEVRINEEMVVEDDPLSNERRERLFAWLGSLRVLPSHVDAYFIKKEEIWWEEGRRVPHALVTVTTGRKLFMDFEKEKFERICDYFGIKKMGSYFSVKGTGSPFTDIYRSNINGRDSITGITGETNDHEMNMRLSGSEWVVRDIDGESLVTKYIPGRILLAAVDLRQIRVHDGVVSFDELEKLNIKEVDRPVALIHSNWSKYNYQDVISLVIRSRNKYLVDLWGVKEGDTEGLLESMVGEIYDDLLIHPSYGGRLSLLEKNDKFFTAKFWAVFAALQIKKDYIESQIVEAEEVYLANRHNQNMMFGGQVDFEGSVERGIQERCDSYFGNAVCSLADMLSFVLSVFSERKKEVFVRTFREEIALEQIAIMLEEEVSEEIEEFYISGVLPELIFSLGETVGWKTKKRKAVKNI